METPQKMIAIIAVVMIIIGALVLTQPYDSASIPRYLVKVKVNLKGCRLAIFNSTTNQKVLEKGINGWTTSFYLPAGSFKFMAEKYTPEKTYICEQVVTVPLAEEDLLDGEYLYMRL